MPSFKAYAAFQKDAPLREFEYEPRPLGDEDVTIKVECCGICGSDIHTIDSGWGPTKYPCVVGHEIVGKVVEKGPKAVVEIGQRVGVGAMCWACLKDDCESQFAVKIPDNLPSDVAAPLLCAGVTVFAPLRRFGAGPGKRVGVAGIGGLGHLAIQFASKMGAETVAISTSTRKAEDAKKLGAKEFYVLGAKDAKGKSVRIPPLDLLVVTAVDRKTGFLDPLLRAVKPDGVLVMVDVPERPLVLTPGGLVAAQKAIYGSSIGPLQDLRDCLNFAAMYGVHPWIDVMPLKACNEAVNRVRAGDTRFRVVLRVEGQQPKL
ncbi:hypothetical protein HDU96_005757 [Phlyctochytrium bullatum]|nr:hypothetical protein HDU96_005757 [Phlyctochytrium bullatum]